MMIVQQFRSRKKSASTRYPSGGADELVEFERFLQEMIKSPKAPIGSSYYYVHAIRDTMRLYQITSSGNLYFSRIVDHQSYGISDDDLKCVTLDPGALWPSEQYYPITDHIERKLRVLIDP